MAVLHRLTEKLRNHPKLKRILKNIYQNSGDFISNKKTFPETIKCVTDENYEHLFGYYDKSPWNSSGDEMIFLRVENASKEAAPLIPALIILKNMNTENEQIIAQTNAWNVQQGCMLQWLGPDFSTDIIYNDYRNGEFCSVILNIKNNEERILPFPVYSVSQGGDFAISLDFSRLHTLRPGYGYRNKKDLTADSRCPTTPCIWYLDLNTKLVRPLLNYDLLRNFDYKESMDNAFHKVNHIMINPSGSRFMFLHRWIKNGIKYDRLLTCNIDGSDIFKLMDDDIVSHSNWKDDHTIITYANKHSEGKNYYLLNDKTSKSVSLKNKLPEVDGHPSFSPNGKFILTDTYPNLRRKQKLYLYDMETENLFCLAEIYSSKSFKNDTRCDLHPRWKRDSNEICFDGAQKKKRQIYTIKI